jgi:hypothetical protein
VKNKSVDCSTFATPTAEIKTVWRSWISSDTNIDMGLSPGPLKEHITKVRDANSSIRDDLARFKNMLKKLNT